MLPRGVILLLCLAAATTSFAQADPRQAGNAVNFAFATELGSGIYELSGRSLQVYRFTPAKLLRSGADGTPQLRLVLPLTLGFFDFSADDVLDGQLPSSIDSFSVMPGLELDYSLRDDWHLVPFLRAGGSFVAGSADSWLFSTGLRLERTVERGNLQVVRLHDVTLAAVEYRGAIPDDQFVRIRSGLELRRRAGAADAPRAVAYTVYGIIDVVPDPPAVMLGVGKASLLQAEAGIGIAPRPGLRLFGWLPLPALGLGYRQAGDFSGWRLVFGAPF